MEGEQEVAIAPAAKRKKVVNTPPKRSPLEYIERAKSMGIQDVIVSFSGGKQSIVCLDLCVKHFRRVEAFHMYWVKDLEFKEYGLRDAEQRYGIKIARLPDFRLARHIKYASFRHPTKESQSMPLVTCRQLEMFVRYELFHGILWIASGESVCESVQRVGMIRSCKGVDRRRGHIYPIGEWGTQDVYSYISMAGLKLPPEYDVFGTGASYGGLRMEHVATVKEVYPSDYAKIKRMFPLIDVQLDRWRIEQQRQAESGSAIRSTGSVHGDVDRIADAGNAADLCDGSASDGDA